MDIGYEVIFTITGVVLVFMVLVLLAFIILLEGKIFDKVSGKGARGNKAAAAAPAPAPKRAAPAPAKRAAAPVQAPAPQAQVAQGVPNEVVAAIMAAICAFGGGKYTLKAVRRGHNNWGRAGVNDTTAPF